MTMKIELDMDDLFILGGTVCVVMLILMLRSCEQQIDARVKERLKQEQHER